MRSNGPRTQVASLRRATDLAELRYAEGEIAYLELLDVRRGLFAAEIELISAPRRARQHGRPRIGARGGPPAHRGTKRDEGLAA